MNIKYDLTGMKCGKLTVIHPVDVSQTKNKRRSGWYCECECGNSKIVETSELRNGGVKSCGCLRTGRPALDERKKRIFNIIKTQPGKTSGEIGKMIGLSDASVLQVLKKLESDAKIKRKKEGRFRWYEVKGSELDSAMNSFLFGGAI